MMEAGSAALTGSSLRLETMSMKKSYIVDVLGPSAICKLIAMLSDEVEESLKNVSKKDGSQTLSHLLCERFATLSGLLADFDQREGDIDKHVVNTSQSKQDDASGLAMSDTTNIVSNVYEKNVKPFLHTIIHDKTYTNSMQQCFPHLLNIIQKLDLPGNNLVTEIISMSVDALKHYNAECQLSHGMVEDEIARISVVITVLFHIMKKLPAHMDSAVLEGIYLETSQCMMHGDTKVVGRIMSSLIPEIFKRMHQSHSEKYILHLWETMYATHREHRRDFSTVESLDTMSERSVFLLCGLSNIFFPVARISAPVTSLLQGTDFWDVIQSNLYHSSTVTRKRAMYLLKRILDILERSDSDIDFAGPGQCLFWWKATVKKSLVIIWQTYVLLLETLEEKQTHVIRPLMPRLQLIIDAVCTSGSDVPLLHCSWLTCLAKRGACHDSKQIQRWVVTELLNINYGVCPFYQHGQLQFLCGAFIQMMSVSSLYHKPGDTSLGECPPVGKAMCSFFRNISLLQNDKLVYEFFNAFLKGLRQQYWSGASLVFVTRALSYVESRPVLTESAVPDVRELMTTVLANLAVHLRSAIQFYVMTAFLKLIDTTKLSLASFCCLLPTLKARETICFGSSLHVALVNFMERVSSNEGPTWGKEAVLQHLNTSVQNFLKENAVTNKDQESDVQSREHMRLQAYQIVRLLLVITDSGLFSAPPGDKPLLEVVLVPVMEVLTTMNVRAYMSIHKAHRAMFFMMVLIEERTPIHHDSSILKDLEPFVMSCLDDILLFINRHTSATKLDSDSTISFYCDIIRVFAEQFWREFCGSAQLLPLLQSCTQTLHTHKLRDELDNKLVMHSSLLIIAEVASVVSDHRDAWEVSWVQLLLDFCKDWLIMDNFTKPQELMQENQGGGRTWGKIAADFLSSQWTCQFFYLKYIYVSNNKSETVVLDSCLAALDVIGGQNMLPVLRCVKYLIKQEPEWKQVEALRVCWTYTQEVIQHATFWDGFSQLMDILLQPDFLARPADSLTGNLIQKVLEDIFRIGEERLGIVNQVISKLCTWAVTDDQCLEIAARYIPVYIQGLMFGPVHSRGKRFDNEVLQFVKTQKDLPSNEINGSSKEDVLVRVEVLSFMACLQKRLPAHKVFAKSVIRELIAEYRSLCDLNTYRNFANSMQHRQKHRVFCGLLLLQHFIDEDLLPEVFAFLCDMLLRENQPSLRCMIEWMTILLIHRWQHLLGDVWRFLDMGSEKKAAFLASLLSIVGHLGKLHDNSENQVRYMNQALPHVLPWCMAHHFNIRVYGQATLLSLWSICRTDNLQSVLSSHSIVENFVQFTETNRSASKNTFKLMENFFFKFHPLNDYSIETIVDTLPRLTCITDEEWISPDMFLAFDISWADKAQPLPLYNGSGVLKHCTPGTWRIRQDGPGLDTDDGLTGDVQKKMIPWRQMMPEAELDTDLLEDYEKKRRKCGGLVLVASLIDKLPNLGGLCRSSEIFGVSEFVISNLRLVQDSVFESLSVSAHKWIPMKQVRPEYLKDYLMEMKDSGYTLVGAEQTAESCCLTEFTFHEKTLLLLGNEKEGIPVELLQLLDVCVEIPQQGIVRSLNVHVSGALLIWEYARQQAQRQT